MISKSTLTWPVSKNLFVRISRPMSPVATYFRIWFDLERLFIWGHLRSNMTLFQNKLNFVISEIIRVFIVRRDKFLALCRVTAVLSGRLSGYEPVRIDRNRLKSRKFHSWDRSCAFMNQISVLSDSVYFIIMHQGVNLHLGHVILRARSNEVKPGSNDLRIMTI